MATTRSAINLLAIARVAGLTDCDVLEGRSGTSKLARLRLPNGRLLAPVDGP